jgi:hypothetical protein
MNLHVFVGHHSILIIFNTSTVPMSYHFLIELGFALLFEKSQVQTINLSLKAAVPIGQWAAGG